MNHLYVYIYIYITYIFTYIFIYVNRKSHEYIVDCLELVKDYVAVMDVKIVHSHNYLVSIIRKHNM